MPASADYPVWATIPMDGGTSFFSSQTLQPNMILAMLDGGFRVGSDPAVNRAGVTYYYVAGRDDPRVIQAGSYLGNGSASRVIQTAMSSALTYAVVKGEGRATVQRPTALTGNASLFFGAFANDLNAILELDAGTFTIGKSVQTNDAGVLYWWFAVSAFDAGSVDGGSGDGGLNDAGATDAGAVDAGVDSGTADAGGAPEPDAGQGAGNFGIGCGCGSSGGPPLGFFALIAWAACNRRRARAY
jgi:hypothetical protein